MIDAAQTKMSQGAPIAIELVSGVNDNMSKSHYHDYYELYYLDAGERYHIVNDRLLKVQAGDCIIFPPHTMHMSYGDKDVPFSRAVLYFTPDMVMSDRLQEQLMAASTVFRPDEQQWRALRRIIYHMLEENDASAEYRDEEMIALLNQVLIQILRTGQVSAGVERRNRITGVIHYIHQNYAHEITLSELSAEFYVSSYYLCREFKKSTGRTIVEYIQGTRIMNAKRLFMETDKNVSEVAAETGFSSLTHFNRVYKSLEGENPSEYRNKCRELHNESRGRIFLTHS